ncbi:MULTISPECIES: hypothetical protein [Cyanophyceae]|uniref:hypothetical protein n=1 Tax=Cyanophyceae TaxID=3028117 RepID=UPI001681C652|nr:MULTISPECIES: hypothetical protein [Cyanophyceae]MBD1918910.1 hypothetical protein [Phormidium sp. FACHB-77]MBD2033248.1 hypothetical protein [Phormidium sp. FACHB-322]MBD2053819.1 hypothetical protein [Leptolyngbya sp. FACHB-60]
MPITSMKISYAAPPPSKPPLMAITLHRPWPYAVINLGKPIENRPWPCPLKPGSFLAIHAGKKYDRQGARWIRETLDLEFPLDGPEHPTGIVAIARFVGNVTASDSPWFVGPIGWQFADVVEILPVQCNGQQRLWRVSGDLLLAVREAYRTATQVAA